MFDITGVVGVVEDFGDFFFKVGVIAVFEAEEPVFAVAEVVVPIFFGKKFRHEVAVEFIAGSGEDGGANNEVRFGGVNGFFEVLDDGLDDS